MKYLKTYNESFMNDYQKLTDDFNKVKLEFESNKSELWKKYSENLVEIFYELDQYKNDFFNVYRSSTGGRYDSYLEFLDNLFNKHFGDKDFYNKRLKNEMFGFSCYEQDEEKLSDFLEGCFSVMSLFGQLHESFTLHLSIVWGHRENKPLRYTGSTPIISSEGMNEFIKTSLHKENIEDLKMSLIDNLTKFRQNNEAEKTNLGFKSIFFIQLK